MGRIAMSKDWFSLNHAEHCFEQLGISVDKEDIVRARFQALDHFFHTNPFGYEVLAQEESYSSRLAHPERIFFPIPGLFFPLRIEAGEVVRSMNLIGVYNGLNPEKFSEEKRFSRKDFLYLQQACEHTDSVLAEEWIRHKALILEHYNRG